jgi:hypothetical protein
MRTGVPLDGFVEGTEFTRERRGASYEARWAELIKSATKRAWSDKEEEARAMKVLESCDR